MTAKLRFGLILLTFGVVTAGLSFGQDAAHSVDVYSQAELLAMGTKMAQKTDSAGIATQPLKKYSIDTTGVTFRKQSGQAELHEKVADFFVVVDGKATLVTGGHILNPATSAPGEVRGDSVQDGTETKLKKGDIVHIPANTPHQLILAKGETFQYFVIKVQEGN
jgi:mannose-6-phosphate isomerase-like protein (cupin superfamily)